MDTNSLRRLIAFTRLWFILALALWLFAGCGRAQEIANTGGAPQAPDAAQTPINPDAAGAATGTPEPIVPTRTPEARGTGGPVVRQEMTSTATRKIAQPPAVADAPPATIVGATRPRPLSYETSELARFGLTISRIYSDAEAAHAQGLPFGSALNWNVMKELPDVPADFWQLVRVSEEGIRRTSWDIMEEVLAAHPGSYWIVGNEPDVHWQDNVTPQRYAEIYHEVYTFIKERDPGARVVIGGVAQPTPLRRAYLDSVLDAYESTYGRPMPVDVWNVHAFILREEEDSWGVGIPPGMAGEEGILYEIEDHDDVQLLAQHIRDFRKWMAERGYGDRPLVISEYGILMPEDYGFPPERVSAFMESTFDLFREMEGAEGYAQDGNRLVQWWFWYSLYDGLLYSTGNLWDEETGQLTQLGQTWIRYIHDNNISTGND